MKKTCIFASMIIIFIFFCHSSFADESMQDVVYLKSSSVVKGEIIEINPAPVHVKTTGGVKVYKLKKTHTISKKRIDEKIDKTVTTKQPSTINRGVVLEKSAQAQLERGSVNITARLQTGYLTGEANEYVYESGHTISKLTWKIDDIYMIGAGISVQPLSWLAINADGWLNISDGNGTMDDYDYLSFDTTDWTHWSHHGNTDVTKGIMLDINIELIPFTVGPVTFSCLLGYKRDNWEWEARGGSYVYSENGFRDTSGTFKNELGITYEQTFEVPYIGIGMNGDFGAFDLKARIIGSSFVSGEAVDHHHLRNFVSYHDFSVENMFAFDIAAAYSFTEQIAAQMALNHTKYDTTKGDTDWHGEGTVYLFKDAEGADLEATMISLSLHYSF